MPNFNNVALFKVSQSCRAYFAMDISMDVDISTYYPVLFIKHRAIMFMTIM